MVIKTINIRDLTDTQIKKLSISTIICYNAETLKYLIKHGYNINKKLIVDYL